MSHDYRLSHPAWSTGTPCWIDLATSNEQSAQRFYRGLFGWSYQVHHDPTTRNQRYSVASTKGASASGLYQSRSGNQLGWIVQLAVTNAGSAAHRVEQLGGKVTLKPVSVPQRGSIFYAVEPTGTPLAFWQPIHPWVFEKHKPNTFTGADLNTHNGALADYFFSQLLHYQSHQLGDGQGIDYTQWCLDGEPVLYRYVMGTEYRPTTPPHWMIYFSVEPAEGVESMARRAIQLGGSVVVDPYDTLWGRICVLADAEGFTFSVIDHSRTSSGWGDAEVDDPFDD
jgi:hypothetical protein